MVLAALGLLSYPALSQNRANLDEIKREIQKIESKLKASEAKERTLLEQVEDIDRKAGLQKKLIRQLELEKSANIRAIQQTENDLGRAVVEYNKLLGVVRKRLVFLYKRGQMKDWEALITLSSVSQALVWLRYQKRILNNDMRNLQQLREKEQQVREENDKLQAKLQRQVQLIQEKTSEAENLDRTRKTRNRLLTQIRRDKVPLKEELRVKQLAYRQIERLINQQENKQKSKPVRWDGVEFAKHKGSLDWPVKGRIVSKFGKHRDPVLRTVIPDLGVKIQAAEQASVQAVFSGEVTIVTWMRGIGNMILVNHGGGYYTVYGHLEAVYVVPGEEVHKGTLLGQVGEKNSLYQSNLNFGVWALPGPNPVDPVPWMKRG